MLVAAKANIPLALAAFLGTTSAIAADERASATLEWHPSEPAAECLDVSALTIAVEAGLHRTGPKMEIMQMITQNKIEDAKTICGILFLQLLGEGGFI